MSGPCQGIFGIGAASPAPTGLHRARLPLEAGGHYPMTATQPVQLCGVRGRPGGRRDGAPERSACGRRHRPGQTLQRFQPPRSLRGAPSASERQMADLDLMARPAADLLLMRTAELGHRGLTGAKPIGDDRIRLTRCLQRSAAEIGPSRFDHSRTVSQQRSLQTTSGIRRTPQRMSSGSARHFPSRAASRTTCHMHLTAPS